MFLVDSLPFIALLAWQTLQEKRTHDSSPRWLALLYSKLRSFSMSRSRCRPFCVDFAFLVVFQQVPRQWSHRFHPQSDCCYVDAFQTFWARCGEGEVVEILKWNVAGMGIGNGIGNGHRCSLDIDAFQLWMSAHNDDDAMAATTGDFINQASSCTPVHLYTPCDYLVTRQWGV